MGGIWLKKSIALKCFIFFSFMLMIVFCKLIVSKICFVERKDENNMFFTF